MFGSKKHGAPDGSDALLGPELMARVKAIRIRTNRLVSSALAGGYKSSFKGSGIEFEEVRAYQVGDDVRSIDWKVTARKGEPQVKTFREDRQLALHLLVDTGRSMDFGTRRVTKRELAAEFCALLSFVALGTRDRVGLTLFGKESGLHLASGRTSAHVNRLVREVIAAEPTLGQTNFVQMLEERVRDRAQMLAALEARSDAAPLFAGAVVAAVAFAAAAFRARSLDLSGALAGLDPPE